MAGPQPRGRRTVAEVRPGDVALEASTIASRTVMAATPPATVIAAGDVDADPVMAELVGVADADLASTRELVRSSNRSEPTGGTVRLELSSDPGTGPIDPSGEPDRTPVVPELLAGQADDYKAGWAEGWADVDAGTWSAEGKFTSSLGWIVGYYDAGRSGREGDR